MTNDGVRDHGDGYEDEVRSEPRICGISCEERHEEIAGDCAATTNDKSDSQVLELETR
jgi:hypothetical protein